MMMRREIFVGGVLLMSVIAAAGLAVVGTRIAGAQMQMPGMPSSNALVPPALAYAKGQEVYFIHPEASDRKVAEVLTKMMGPQVLTVPSLGQIPARLLGDVYVFTNGVKGNGPLGFQPDVFPTVPGDRGYTPLRRLTLVTWKSNARARVVKSAAEIQAVGAKGDVTLARSDVVVNMPILTWPGGKR